MTRAIYSSPAAPAARPGVSKCAPQRKLISRVHVKPQTLVRFDALARQKKQRLADLVGEILDQYVEEDSGNE